MNHTQRLRRYAIALATVLAAYGGVSSARGDIISEWANVKPPPVPELKPAVVDGKTTALLILDLMKANCGQRPRCLATVPNVKKLHDEARAAGMMVFYTLVGGPNPTPADVVDPGIAPREGEWVVQRGPDKFLGSPLEERLKAHGIKTVIVTGTSAQGAVVGTGSGQRSAVTKLSCRSTVCRPTIPTWNNTLLGTCTRAGLPSSPTKSRSPAVT